MAVIDRFTMQPVEVRVLTLDFCKRLTLPEELSGVTAEVSPAGELAANTALSIDNKNVIVTIGPDGVSGTRYTVTITSTDGSRVWQDEIVVTVREITQ